jgi:hypothetical protein
VRFLTSVFLGRSWRAFYGLQVLSGASLRAFDGLTVWSSASSHPFLGLRVLSITSFAQKSDLPCRKSEKISEIAI